MSDTYQVEAKQLTLRVAIVMIAVAAPIIVALALYHARSVRFSDACREKATTTVEYRRCMAEYTTSTYTVQQ